MTNREYMINQLSNPNWIDDSGASYEATIFYNIGCPYFAGDKRCKCDTDFDKATRETCYECKEMWLDSEVDE